MLTFLHGDDTYSARQKLREFIRIDSGTRLRWDCSTDSVFYIEEALRSQTLFSDKQMHIIERPFAHKDWNLSVFDRAIHDIVFFEPGSADKRSALFKYLSKNARVQEYAPLQGIQLKTWIQKEFDQYEFSPSLELIDQLGREVGSDLWQLSNEIRKVATAHGEYLHMLVAPNIRTNIFDTLEAIASQNKKKALRLLAEHLGNNESPYYIFSMLQYQFRNLLCVKQGKAPKLHPFVLKKTMQLAQSFSLEDLMRAYRRLLLIDQQMKTGQVLPEHALYLFAAYPLSKPAIS